MTTRSPREWPWQWLVLRTTPVERGVLIAAVLLGTLLRLRPVGSALLFGDELHSLGELHAGLSAVLTHFSPTGAGMALPLLQLPFVELFGPSHWAIRAPAWIAGLALLVVVYPISRRILGAGGALITTLLISTSPILIFYSHFGRSYSLVALLSFLLLGFLNRFVNPTEANPRPPLLGATLVTAALPWVHPTAVAFVVPVYAGVLLAIYFIEEDSETCKRLLGALMLGGLICVALHLPAWESMTRYMTVKTSQEYYGAFGILDVMTLLAGSRTMAALLVLLCLASIVDQIRVRGGEAFPMILALVAPPIIIAVVSPYGDAYAYARYLLPSLIPAYMLVATTVAGWIEGFELESYPLRRAWAGAGLALAAVPFVAGPVSASLASPIAHANTYLSLYALPAFDTPWAGMPRFYHDLASEVNEADEDLTIIEMPALTNRTRHLYRNYALVHGARTMLAPFPQEFPRHPEGPYVSLSSLEHAGEQGADYLVLHPRIGDEVDRYWQDVYGTDDPLVVAGASARWPERVRAYMERHARHGGTVPPASPALIARIESLLGPPTHREPDVLVWRLR